MKPDLTPLEQEIDRILQPCDPYDPAGRIEILTLEVEKLRLALTLLLARTEDGMELAQRVETM